MPEKLTDEMNAAMDKAREQMSDAALVAKQKAEDLARQAESKVDAARGPAASSLEDAASTLHQRAENLPSGSRVRGVAHATANKLADAAAYVRNHNVRDTVADVDRTVRRYPAQSLLTAKDMTDVMRLHSEYLQGQMSSLAEQASEMGQAVTRAAMDAAKPKT